MQSNNITDKRRAAVSQDLQGLGVFPNAIICIFSAPRTAAELLDLIISDCLCHHA